MVADEALTEVAVADKLPDGFKTADLADFAFEDEPVIWIHNFKQLIGLRDSVQNWEYNFMYGWNYAPFEQISL